MATTFDPTFGLGSNFLHEFSLDVFLEVTMESQFRDEEVWAAIIDYRVIMTITYDPTVESRSNFGMSSRRIFPWGCYGIATGDEQVWTT
ncbi:hypothetical protein, partial [Vibrio ouci]|uniref:hypothetical protein n=1 Tax=Vibrio ouci TaxID=2499078 RepID=UPI001ABFCA40